MADRSRHTGFSFLLRNGVGKLPSVADSRFPFMNSDLDVDCTRGLSSSSSEVNELCAQFFDLSRQISASEWIAHAILAHT